MGTYLTKLKNAITETQSKQIINLLIKQKQTGDIQNLEEFRNRLTDLTNQLLSDHITPSLTLFLGEVNGVIDAETYDFMIERIRDDLQTAFNESNSLSEVLEDHKNIINNVLLQSIKLAIAELDSKISTYEFLAKNDSGFDNAQFNTFKASQITRTARTDKEANTLFMDPRTQGLIEDDITIDPVGEDILLPLNTNTNILPKNVRQIFDTDTVQSSQDVSFQSNNINNIIDGSPGTYWTYSILQNQLSNNGIKAKIELDLGNYVDVNNINIEAASIFPMTLLQVQYNDPNNQLQSLTLNETISNVPQNIYFNRITTNRIILVIQQTNALELQYVNKTVVNNYDAAVAGESLLIDTDSIATAIKDLITSSAVVTNAFLIPDLEPDGEQVRLYDYLIGFDNIRIGYSTFLQKGIFVSSPLNINSLGQLAIKTKETRPQEIGGVISNTTNTYTNQYFHGSIEYWAVIYNYDSTNQLIDIDQVPLLPIGIDRIYHENLVLSNAVESNIPNVGILMFYTDHTNNINSINVYRNGTLLTNILDWIIEDTLTNDVVPPSGKPNKVAIRILHPSLTDFYTVSYNPLVTNTLAHPANVNNNISLTDPNSYIKIIDLVGDGSVRIGSNNILYISQIKDNGKITESSKIYLSIIIRRGSTNENLSSAVQEYLLLTSSNDMEKFNGK